MRLECKRQWTWEVAWCSELLKKPFLQLFLQLFDLIVQNIEAVITAICWCLSNFILFGCLSPMVDVARSINFGACPSFHPWPTIFHFSRYHPFHFLNNVVLFPLWIFSSLLRKNCFSFRFCPKSTPHTPPIWTTCTTFLRRRSSKFERQFMTKTSICNIYHTIYIPPKKQLKVQINANYLEEIVSFIDQKCTSWKCDKKILAGPSPPHLDKIQKNSIFFSGERPLELS